MRAQFFRARNEPGFGMMSEVSEAMDSIKTQTLAGRVTRLIAPTVGDLGLELVGVEFNERGMLVRVYIDRDGGVGVSDCEAVSRRVGGLLDAEDIIERRYRLEVSSPGADRPLFTPAHYRRFLARHVKLVLATPQSGRRRWTGILRGCDDGKVIIEVDDETRAIPLEQVASARLIPEFIRSALKQ